MYSLARWPDLCDQTRQSLNSQSTLFTCEANSLWETIGGKLLYAMDAESGEAVPIFVKRFGPLAHAQLFVQGLAVSLPDNPSGQTALFDLLRRSFHRVTVVDYENLIAQVAPQWQRNTQSAEIVMLASYREPEDSTLRSELRKSEREGLEVRVLSDDSEMIEAIELFKNHGKQHPKRFPLSFLRVLAQLSLACSDIIWLEARHENKVVASQVFVRFGPTTLYWLSVLDRSSVHLKPAVALLHAGLRRSAALGARYCNLGGTPTGERGLLEFKRRWGSKPHDYSIYSHSRWWLPG